jgi:peptide/nickel transport system permease protein
MQPTASEITIQRIEERKHLNESIPVQYVYWLKDMLTNQFGTTTIGDRPILPDLTRVMGHTLQLVVAAELLAILFAVGIGVYSALRQYSVFDYSATTFSFVGLATPVFWLALILQVLFVYIYLVRRADLLRREPEQRRPGSGLHFASTGPSTSRCRSWSSWSRASPRTRATCASMLEVVNADYVRTARSKGLTERSITMGHAFRNALIPLVTLVALNFGALLSGIVVVETIFALDGMGLYFINALNAGDPYPIMAFLMVTATMIILMNLVADIAYGYLDPRVRVD